MKKRINASVKRWKLEEAIHDIIDELSDEDRENMCYWFNATHTDGRMVSFAPEDEDITFCVLSSMAIYEYGTESGNMWIPLEVEYYLDSYYGKENN